MNDRMVQCNMLTTAEAAEYIGFSEISLRRWRSQGTGPKYLKLGARRVRYRREDLDAWVDSGSSTAQT